ncbi:MAG: hypothetical protein M1375_02515 [Candidatus Thermoplasmatota archaeon]|jgi:hypothetical protein|nr:hypothetical protein [Candidatus Thermoplasmatota archaeon]MCL5790829.1 hypothetical protein [Candidatus Thermoplasmatota archaeon]
MAVDYSAFKAGDDSERKDVLRSFYSDLVRLNKEDQVKKIVEFIENVARETDDEEYEHICRLSMEVFLSLKNVDLKELMAVRLEAQFELPEEDRLVDSINLLKAIESMPERDRLLEMIRGIER